MDGTLAAQLLELVRAARASAAEWSDEGWDRIESHPRAEPASARASPTIPEPSTPGATRDLFGAEASWGEGVTLERVREELGECTRCRLAKGRTQIVFGDGNPTRPPPAAASWMGRLRRCAPR